MSKQSETANSLRVSGAQFNDQQMNQVVQNYTSGISGHVSKALSFADFGSPVDVTLGAEGPGGNEPNNLPSNPEYHVRIYQRGSAGSPGLEVYCNAPPEFDFQLQNEYEDFFGIMESRGGFLGDIGAGIGQSIAVAKTFGAGIQPRLFNVQVWAQTAPLELPITLNFKAIRSAQKDVVDQVKTLIQMCSPSSGSGSSMLHSPGPNIIQAISAVYNGHFMPERAISLRIGKKVTFSGLLLVSLQGKWANRFDKDGLPISAEVQATFRSFVPWSREEIAQAIFK